jgi:hypothetical protein
MESAFLRAQVDCLVHRIFSYIAQSGYLKLFLKRAHINVGDRTFLELYVGRKWPA